VDTCVEDKCVFSLPLTCEKFPSTTLMRVQLFPQPHSSQYTFPQFIAMSYVISFVDSPVYVRFLTLWRSTVVRISVYDWWTFPDLRHDMQLTGHLLGVNKANSAIYRYYCCLSPHPRGVYRHCCSYYRGIGLRCSHPHATLYSVLAINSVLFVIITNTAKPLMFACHISQELMKTTKFNGANIKFHYLKLARH